MKLLLVVLSIVVTLKQNAVLADDVLASVSQLLWNNRVLIIESEQNQTDEIERYTEEILDRDIIWFQFNDEGIKTNYPNELAASFATDTKGQYINSEDALVLIGKDGGVKLRQASINLKQIFALIDTMPMRIEEMNR